MPTTAQIATSDLDLGRTRLRVARTGDGPVVVLLHGWPHTWQLWEEVVPALAETHTVLAPDLRGLGGSAREQTGYDARSGAADVTALLDHVGATSAAVVAIDAGVPAATMLALTAPERVSRLVVMESLVPGRPGAEAFLAAGPPWWFGFHAVPGLAETVVQGHEAAYVDWFLTEHSVQEVPQRARDAFVAAYTGREALRCGFEHYRAATTNAAQFAEVLADRRLTVPTLAVAGGVVGDALAGQLRPLADDLETATVADCGHLVPLEQPEALAALLLSFLPDP